MWLGREVIRRERWQSNPVGGSGPGRFFSLELLGSWAFLLQHNHPWPDALAVTHVSMAGGVRI
jgi:hypothetical protein